MMSEERQDAAANSSQRRKRIRCITPPRARKCSHHEKGTSSVRVDETRSLESVNSLSLSRIISSAEDLKEFCHWCSDALPSELKEVLSRRPQNLQDVDEYHYTNGEAFANFITHFLCIPGAAYAFYRVIQATNTRREAVVISVYGSMLMALFLVSTLYHFVFMLEIWHSCLVFCHRIRPWRKFMLVMDRSVVHLFIAGCYTPWLILRDNGSLGMYMCQAMWIATISGIIIQRARLVERDNRLIFLYLFVGILPGTFMIVCMTDNSGLPLIGIGGLAYLTGLMFFFSDGYVPYAHAIWHCFVIIGVYLHYRAMVDYLLRQRRECMPTVDDGIVARIFTGAVGFVVYGVNLALRGDAEHC